MQVLSIPGSVVPPRGIHSTRVDEKGRLKLPVIFQQYLAAFGQKDVFCTSLDKAIARVYPISTWIENEKLFEQGGPNAAALSRLQHQANRMGADSAVDDAGRILMPQKLRQALNIENATVYLQCQKGAISVFSESAMAARDAEVESNLSTDLQVAETLGIK